MTERITQPDPGHLLPPDEWARVTADAQRLGALRDVHPVRAYGLLQSAFPSVSGFLQCKYDGGARPGAPTFGVLHDAETPLAAGYAASIAGYFTRTTNETSAHFMVDPVATVQMLDTARVAWHCGNGNPRSVGVEQAGYAAFTAAQWATADGLQQMGRVAALMRDLRAAHGIGLYWMTDAQLRDAHAGRMVGGWATHDQCSRVLGGSTHSDPMPRYPLDQLMQLANSTEEPDVQLSDPIPNANPEAKTKVPTTTVGNLLQDTQANAFYAARQTAGLAGAVQALAGLLAQQNGLTVADVQKAVADAVAAGIAVHVDVQPGGTQA